MTKSFKIFFCIAVFLLLSCAVSICASNSKNIVYYRFDQVAVSKGSMSRSAPILQKSKRVSNQAGRIDIYYEGDIPSGLRTGIQAAADRWASVIKNKQLIRIIVLMEDLPNDLCSKVEVGYSSLDDKNIRYPTALLAELTGNEYSDEEYPNAFISLNPKTVWDTTFNNESEISGVNIYSCALRSFALVFGFGSSVITKDGGVSFSYHDINPSIFDNIIISNNLKMASLPGYSQSLKDFVTRDNIYALREEPNYKLYSPNPYEPGKSLVYFDNENSLMHYDFGSGDQSLNIDQYVVEILNEIGWAIEVENSRFIICDDIDESGLGSAYKSHVFKLNDVSGISNYNWSFVLYDNLGIEHIISNGSGSQFEIQPLQDIGNYKTNSNGDIIGSIICTYSLNGKQENSTFTVFFEQQPAILSIENKVIHPADNYEGFYLTFDVYYQGADTIYIDLEEEYSSSLRSQIIYSPYKASVKTGNINPYNYAWVDIKVYNKYGEAVETIELEPAMASAETFDYEISNIKYDYTVSVKNGEYDIMGDFSFDVKVNNIPEFIIANTNPDGHIKDFYSALRIFEADPNGVTEKKYMRPYTQPETFFKLLIRKKDGSFFSSPAICSTDYLREEDKALLSSGIPAKYVSEGLTIDIKNSTLRLSSGLDMQKVSLININGNVIKHIDLCNSQNCEISLADIPRGFYIVCITDTEGRNYNRKIIY